MPFENRGVSAMREEFVRDVLAGMETKAALCRKYGISRPTGDKWITRFLETGSCEELSRAPLSSPERISPEIETLIIETRNEFPAFGAVKLRRILENRGYSPLPSVGTFNNVLRRHNLLDPKAQASARHIIRFEMAEANDMWQMDYKGDILLGDKTRCHPLNIVDDCTRFLLCCRAQKTESFSELMPLMTDLFREYGLPLRIQCDNGNPWGNAAKDSITGFEVRMMDLGILVTHSTIRHPQTQGKVESFNRSFTRECLKGMHFSNLNDAQTTFDAYRQTYNEVRPHHALNLHTPSSIYKKSSRQMPESVREWEYTAEYEVKKTMPSGAFYFKGGTYFLSEAMGSRYIGIRESDNDGEYIIVYRQFRIAVCNLRNRSCGKKRIYLLNEDPRNASNHRQP